MKVINSSTQYLEGPSSRGKELVFLWKVMWQFLRGFRKLHFIGPCITVFGSARFKEDHPEYIKARHLGKCISEIGFTTMTGGGPGIMEAANRGAKEHGGKSVGCAITLPHEQSDNPYMDMSIRFDYFFVRKFLLLKYSYAFIVMPGGFGTLDEFFETLTLIQTGILHHFPVVVMGIDYYQEIKIMVDKMIDEETISEKDKELLLFTDDCTQAMDHIKHYIEDHYQIKEKSTKRLWWLGE